MLRSYVPTLVLSALAIGFAGCDSAPGPAGLDARPPVLTGLVYAPESIVLGQPPFDDVTGDEVTVSFSFTVQAHDPDDDLASLGYVILSPVGDEEALEEGSMAVDGRGQVSGSVDVVLPKGSVGTYTLLLYAVDQAGNLSNQVRGTVPFSASGEPPVIEEVIADPDVVAPPTTLTLIAVVSDPDGLDNISRVVVRTPSGFEAAMFDDGTGGDEVPADGRYTAVFDVPSATPGIQVFTFQAFDRAGLASEIVQKPITVE